MKARILDLLSRSEAEISGEELRRQLGVSRVAVWKHLQALKDLGYPVSTSKNGYRLGGEADFLHPWEFPEREGLVVFLPETPSTMDVARDLARQGCPSGTVVIAQRQSAGRGRLGREWNSQDGGLYFTLVLRPAIAPAEAFRILFAASVSMAGAVRETCGVPAMVKWPNDLLVEERKLSGMLSEMSAEGDAVEYLNLGVGLNVNNEISGVENPAVSLRGLTGKIHARKKILSLFLEKLEVRLGNLLGPEIMDTWKELSATLGKKVRIETHSGILTGKALDVDEWGALLVEDESGEIFRVTYGDCFHSA